MDSVKAGWGFEVQRFRIIPQKKIPEMFNVPGMLKPGSIWSNEHQQLWIPSSRLITGPNVIIDLAQEELFKRWSAIQGSIRIIEDIAVGDGLTDPTDSDTILTNELESKAIDSWDDSLITPDSSGLSTRKAQVTWLSLEANGTLSELGLKFDNADLVTHALFKKLGISNITQANPAVVTTTQSAHGLSTGDEIHIISVVGMTEVNDLTFTITVVDADEFSLDGIDSTAFGAYISGGDAFLVITKTVADVVQTNYVLTFLN